MNEQKGNMITMMYSLHFTHIMHVTLSLSVLTAIFQVNLG